ncbi:3361_t:CDS:1, partial [Gigaspora rosea]
GRAINAISLANDATPKTMIPASVKREPNSYTNKESNIHRQTLNGSQLLH